MQADSVKFLTKNKMNFQKWIYEGKIHVLKRHTHFEQISIQNVVCYFESQHSNKPLADENETISLYIHGVLLFFESPFRFGFSSLFGLQKTKMACIYMRVSHVINTLSINFFF